MSIRKPSSRSPQVTKRRIFLTQEDSTPFETHKQKPIEEIFNPSNDLSILKKKFDSVKQENIKKTLLLDLLKGQVLELRSTASNIQNEMKNFNDKTNEFELEISIAEEKLSQELDLKKVYEHILSRNKVEGTQLDIKVNKNLDGVRSAKLKMDLESEKARRAKDSKFTAKTQLKDLRVYLDEDTKKHISHIKNLEKNIMTRRELLKRYDERQKRQKEIVELAAKQDRESHEKELREKINMNKILFELLVDKENKYKKAGHEVENAFHDIKTKTGFYNPKEILHKFMNREKIYNKLIEEVDKAESTLSELQKNYYQSRDKLKDYLLTTSLMESQDDILLSENKIVDMQKGLEKLQEQRRKTDIVFIDVVKWCEKTMSTLEIQNKTENIEEGVGLISLEINELIKKAKKDLPTFQSALLELKKKCTQDLVKEIYTDKSPVRVQDSRLSLE